MSKIFSNKQTDFQSKKRLLISKQNSRGNKDGKKDLN